MPADLGEPSMKVPERPAGIVGTARPRALALATKGVGRTRAKDCCAQIPIIRTATLAVRDSTLRHQSPGEEAVGRIGSKGVKGQAMTSMGDHGGIPVFEGLHEVSAQGFRVRARTRRLTR